MPTQIIERAPHAIPRRRFTASALFSILLALLLILNVAPAAAQMAIDFATNASDTTATVHTGYTANCSAQTASVSDAVTPDVGFALANQSMCAITRRTTQAGSASNIDAAKETGQSKTTFWGGGYYDNDFGGETFSVEFDGRLRTAHLGFDIRPRSNLLAGLMMSRSEVDINYAVFDYAVFEHGGDYDEQVTSVNPYINWNVPDGQLELWAIAGYGEGDLEITPNDAVSSSTADVTRRMVVLGGSGAVSKSERAVVRLKGEVFYIRTRVDDTTSDRRAATVVDTNIDAHRARVTVEMESHYALAGGAHLNPSVDVSVRFDDQEEETSTGTEVGIGLRYTEPTLGLTVDFGGRTLIRHNRGDENSYENYYNEWDFSIGGSFQTATGTDGQGLSFSVSPGHGEIAGDRQPNWQALLNTYESKPRMTVRLGYGLPVFGGLLTPYSETSLGGPSKIYRLGALWFLDSFLNLKLTGERRGKDLAILLTGKKRLW